MSLSSKPGRVCWQNTQYKHTQEMGRMRMKMVMMKMMVMVSAVYAMASWETDFSYFLLFFSELLCCFISAKLRVLKRGHG